MFTKAIVRKPCKAMVNGLSSANIGKPDYQQALVQHADYIEALKECGLQVTVLPADENFPDSTFVEDVALLTPRCAILTNPGAPSRQLETRSILNTIQNFYPNVEMIETPFSAPRRLRFDSKGRLWIPGFSSGLISRFDPRTREFKSYVLPIEPLGTETPYALNIQPDTDSVWICGTNSDSLIRFEPEQETFSVYPLPTRVTYTREIDFDEQGRIWTSNSNLPAWQIEDGMPRILRLDPSFRPAEVETVSTSLVDGRD